MKIHQHLGSWVYDNVINTLGEDIVVKKEFVLDELHIEACPEHSRRSSSRHGIHKPTRVLLNSSYKINNLDSAIDSTQYVQSYNYFKRTLTLKQYELTNHLGNVLATVLDRKTFVQDSTGADTLLYYKADVSTATLYYAFGSAIQEMSYNSDTTNIYRFGFNGEELMDELAGEGMAYDLGARFYDARLGRMFSLDTLEDEYPYWSPYAYCGNSPISVVDEKGMGPGDPLKTHIVVYVDKKYKVAKAFYSEYGMNLGLSWGDYWKEFQEWNKNVSLNTLGVTLYYSNPNIQPKVLVEKKLKFYDLITKYSYADYKYHCIERHVNSSSQKCTTILENGYTIEPITKNKPLNIINNNVNFKTPWMKVAESQIGVKEKTNHNDEVEVEKYLKSGVIRKRNYWCASFVNWTLIESGIQVTAVKNNPNRALNWRYFGQSLNNPAFGAIATKTRKGGGHVGFVAGMTSNGRLVILGGNQNNSVNYTSYPSIIIKFNYPFGYKPNYNLPIINISNSKIKEK